MKIAMIGAGSLVFCKTLLNDMFQTEVLAGATYALMSPTESKLRKMETLAQRMIDGAGVQASVWFPVFALVVGSVIGLFYYLRIVAAMIAKPDGSECALPALRLAGAVTLAVLTLTVIWLGVNPTAILRLIHASTLF